MLPSLQAQEVTLDFFGVCVKAAEFSQHLAAMEVLEGQVQALTGELLLGHAAYRRKGRESWLSYYCQRSGMGEGHMCFCAAA